MKKTSEQTSGLKFFGIGKMQKKKKKYRGMMAAMVRSCSAMRSTISSGSERSTRSCPLF